MTALSARYWFNLLENLICKLRILKKRIVQTNISQKKPYSPPKNIAIQSIQVSKWSKKYFNLYALILKAPGKIIVYSPATKRNCR